MVSNPGALKKGEDWSRTMREEFLLTVGYTEEEVQKMQIDKVSEDELRKKIRERILGLASTPKQIVVSAGEVEKYLKEGYEFVSKLSDDSAIIKVP